MDGQNIATENTAFSTVSEAQDQGIADAVYVPPKRRSRTLSFFMHNWELYAMLVPGIASLLVFAYGPMFGLYIAFIKYEDLTVSMFDGSVNTFNAWFNFQQMMVTGGLHGFWGLVRNTLILSTLKLFVGFPMPIILAILINEANNKIFKSAFQTVSYMPYFISWVVVSGILRILIDTDNGLFNRIAVSFGGEAYKYYSEPGAWRPILLITSIWKGVGYSTITYLAILTSIDPMLFEAAMIDGANKLKQIWHITIPGLAGIISINFIMNVGSIFADDADQVLTLAGDNNDAVRETTELLGTTVFKAAMGGDPAKFPVSTAIGMIQGLCSLVLIMTTNFAASKLGATTVW